MTTLPAKSVIQTPARQRRHVSYEAYLQQASETRITEWVDGEVITYMPPQLRHQIISRFLFQIIHNFVTLFQLGEVLYAPFETKLWPDGPSREPDLFFVSNERLSQLKDKRFEGAPDLIVEIVSPGSVREDKVRKFDEYERAGVMEYWLIDPRPRQETAEFFRLDKEQIYQPVEVAENGRYASQLLPHFWLNVDWLWTDPMPNHQVALADIIIADEALPEKLRQIYQGLRDYLQ